MYLCPMIRRVVVSLLFLVASVQISLAQCAMCRGSVESSISDGDVTMAANLNLGILYLFFTPYIVLGVLAFFWYRASKRNARKVQRASHIAG